MKFRVSSNRDVWCWTVLITALSVAVPSILVNVILWHMPLAHKAPYLFIAAGIPFFIAAPVSFFAMSMLKTLNVTVDAVNNLVKFDPLTNVLCRSFFYQQWREGRRKGGYLAIIDADRFKAINDTYGHEVGDEALKHIALGLTQAVKDAGLVGRLGGEEFCIFLPRATRGQARLVTNEICNWFRNVPIRANSNDLQITVSIGLTIDNAVDPIASVMRRADQCLYAAKRAGRDRVVEEIALDGAYRAA